MLKDVVASGAVAEVELLKLNRDAVKLNRYCELKSGSSETDGGVFGKSRITAALVLDF